MLDHAALDLRAFVPGVIAATAAGPGAARRSAPPARLGRPTPSPGDQDRWRRSCASRPTPGARLAPPARELETTDDFPAEVALRSAGVDDEFLESVLRPFLAGVFLEDGLATSRRFLDLVLTSFVKGIPSVPARGMQAIPDQLAAALPAGTVRCGVAARAVRRRSSLAPTTGDIEAAAVIVATEAPAAAGVLIARARHPRLAGP